MTLFLCFGSGHAFDFFAEVALKPALVTSSRIDDICSDRVERVFNMSNRRAGVHLAKTDGAIDID